MASAALNRTLSYSGVATGALVTLAAIGFFIQDKGAESRAANLAGLPILLPLLLLPWLTLLWVAKRYGHKGFGVAVATFVVAAVGAWFFVDALIVGRDPSRVLIFPFVAAVQFVASLVVWISTALIYRRSE